MNPIRRNLLSAWYYASYTQRQRLVQKRAASAVVPISVLFYHRVADTYPNGWTISRDGFAKQINWLKKKSELISLEEVQSRMVNGNDRLATSLTFDDGYSENCEFAIPLLLKEKIPFTYFVSLDFIKTGRVFPHDEKNGQRLPTNTIDQLREMVAAGVEIGAHTDTHINIGQTTDPEVLRREMVDATLELGELVGQPIRYFAFPFGQKCDLNAEAAMMAAEEAGIEAVCSAFGAYNLPGNDPFHIRRIHGDPEFTRWRNWVSIDPRKVNEGQDCGREIEFGMAEGRDARNRRNARERRDARDRRDREKFAAEEIRRTGPDRRELLGLGE